MNVRWILIVLVLCIVLLLPGCKLQSQCLCTEIFMMQLVDLVDLYDQPITDASVTVTFVDSGRQIDCSPYHDYLNGVYCIMNDSFVKQLNVRGKFILVKFQKSGFRTRFETYLFNTDPCKCHINFLDGVTFIVLKPV